MTYVSPPESRKRGFRRRGVARLSSHRGRAIGLLFLAAAGGPGEGKGGGRVPSVQPAGNRVEKDLCSMGVHGRRPLEVPGVNLVRFQRLVDAGYRLDEVMWIQIFLLAAAFET